MQHEVQLGPFILRRRIGRGGMGDVWRARHVEQEVDAAIKVILGEASRTEQAQELFRNEVRAMAALHHAGIVMVFDYGHVPQDIEPTNGLVPGSPYLAMELADDSLASWLHRTWSWKRVRGLVLQVLDALAHAHARGVIHRDLKPENILVMERDGDPPRLKLADFGLARITGDLADRARREGSTRGTPSYMAPEQIAGEQREQGPWTDLYALGCLTYQLLCGTKPFRGSTSTEILTAHLLDPIPPLRPRHPVPDGLQYWITRLLAKDPTDRYRRAADAAQDLLALPHVDETMSTANPETLAPSDDTGETMLGPEPTAILPQDFYALSKTTELGTDRTLFFRPDKAPRQKTGQGAPTWRTDYRSFPDDWRGTEPPPPSMSVLGAGLDLYGLRPIPLVDRELERDQIWAQVRRAVDERRPTITMLSGLAGSGKSRLAEWIAQRADELGAAMTLAATHSPEGGPTDGLPRMIARHARTANLNSQETIARLEMVLSADGRGQTVDMLTVFALAEVLRSTESNSGARSGPQERHTAVLEYVTHLTKRRPVIVWVDNGQWAVDALEFVEMVLRRDDLPVAILVTVRDDELEGQRAEAEILERLEAHERAVSIPVAPLSSDDHRRLVERLLRLEGNLADRVAERTDGNPLFAVQLVGDWVERGVLRPGSDGFELVPDAAADLPDSIHRLWKTRIDRLVHVIDAEPETTRVCLEIAATLGISILEEEWLSACRLAELPIPAELMERMIDRGLARGYDRGWMFVHGMLRETLLDLARESGRAGEHHRLCALLFEPPYGEAPDRPRRHAQHLIGAGEWDRALQPLRVAMKSCRKHAEDASGFALLEQYEAAIDALDCGPDDPRAIAGQLERALSCAQVARLDEASAIVDHLETRLDEELSDDLLPELLFLKLAVAVRRGRPSDGIPCGIRLLELTDANDDANELEGPARRLLGRLYRQTAKCETSLHHLERAVRIFEARGDPLEVGWTHIAIASTHHVSGRAKLAVDHATTALKLFQAQGNVYGVGHAYHSLGEASRHLGDLEAAERHYRDAIEIFERVDLPTIDIEWVNLSLTLISRRTFDKAARILKRLFSNHPAREDAVAMVITSGLACCAAARDDLASWQTMFDTFTQLRAVNEVVTNDVALVLEITAEELVGHGHEQEARLTLRFARDEWRALGNQEESQRTEQLLRQLD